MKEWEDGIGGNRAVKDWPASACASTTCKRDGLCHCLRDLVNSGEQHATALDWLKENLLDGTAFSKHQKVRKRNGTLPASLGV